MTDYPRWVRPAFIGDEPIEALSKGVATRHCDWFVEQLPSRVSLLLSRLDIVDDTGDVFLDRVEAALGPVARQENFWRPSVGPQPIQLRFGIAMVDLGKTLTDDGEALALDVGVLLARELERTVAGLAWGIIRSRRDYVSFNRPLLIGPSPPPFDPQLVGPTIVRHIIRPPERPQPLRQLHATWVRLLGAGS